MWRLALAVCLALLVAPSARAEFPAGTFTIQAENDRIANTDRHYSHGTRLTWVSDRVTDGPAWAMDFLERLYPLAELRAERVGFILGHSIFTPEDTATTAQVVGDRPYAGWLYGGISVHAETTRRFNGATLSILDGIELDLGVVGPAALGEEVQNTVHYIIGVSQSNGWDHQLHNEPGVMLIFERKWRPEPWLIGGLQADVVPSLGGTIGNVLTQASAGAILRLGEQLSVDYGPPHVRPSLSGLAAIDDVDGLAWYVFGGAEGRLVAHSIFLDGNSFSGGPAIDRRPFVGDVQAGAALVYGPARLAFTHVFRTREFDQQRRGDRFGAISLSVRF